MNGSSRDTAPRPAGIISRLKSRHLDQEQQRNLTFNIKALLQGNAKRDPESYAEDFDLQVSCFLAL